MPAVKLAKRPADQRRQEPAEIHADVVDVVGPDAARILWRIQGADLAGQARQEEAIAERDAGERGVEQRLEGHHEMTERHDRAADDHGAAPAQPAVRDNPAAIGVR